MCMINICRRVKIPNNTKTNNAQSTIIRTDRSFNSFRTSTFLNAYYSNVQQ